MARASVRLRQRPRASRFVLGGANIAEVREHAEATSSVAKLQYIDYYLASKLAYLRFNFSTGDAAGQNMVGRATFAACSWILDHYPNVRHFYLESNLATDKKASQVNVMHTRGKRVVAEARSSATCSSSTCAWSRRTCSTTRASPTSALS
jgi:hydroxymethylglutaryl-CoA reductase (NADPH)